MNPPEIALQRIAAAQAQQATTLDLSDCGLTSIPEEVFALEQLEVLILGKQSDPAQRHPQQNQITELPIDFIFLKSLRGLGLNGNQLTEYPAVLAHLTALQTLMLSGNPLRRLPSDLNQLQQLQTLGLEHCRLEQLPEEIGELQALHTLSLSHNQLTTLPDAFAQLQSLQKLGLAHNRFTVFPAALYALPTLQVVNLSHNALDHIPPEVHQMRSLLQLKLAGNVLPEETIQAAERGFSALQHLAAGMATRRRGVIQRTIQSELDPHERQLLKASLLRFLNPAQVQCVLCDGKKKLSGRVTPLNLQLRRETCFGCHGKGTVTGDATDLHRLLSRCIQRRLHLKEQLATGLEEEATYARKLEQNRHSQVLYPALIASIQTTLQRKQQQLDRALYQFQGYQRYERKILQALYNHYLQQKIQQESDQNPMHNWRDDWTLQKEMPDLYLLAGDLERLLDEWESILAHLAAEVTDRLSWQRLRELDTELSQL